MASFILIGFSSDFITHVSKRIMNGKEKREKHLEMRKYKYLLRWNPSTRRSHENKRNNEEDLR